MNKFYLKKIIVVLSFFMLLCATCFMASCEREIINSYDYSAAVFDYSEFSVSDYTEAQSSYSVNRTTTDYADYYFDEKIAVSKRNRFVTFSEQLLDSLNVEQLTDNLLVFFVSNDIKTPRAEPAENTVYFSVSNTKTTEFINYVLQALNTNTLNYGLLHGISSGIFTDLQWGKINTLKESKIKDFLKKKQNRYILDLTYPVFHKKFSSAEQIKYAKSISVRLVDYIRKTHGESAFQQLFEADLTFDMAFDNLFFGYLNEWLGEIKADKVALNTEVLKCVPYTNDFPIRLITNSCNYYMDKDWVDSWIAAHYTYRDFVFNYSSVKNLLLKAELPYERVREFFDYNEKEKVLVFLQSIAYGGLTYSDYFIISSMSALTHEYTHLISRLKGGRHVSWLLEGIACYCDVVFNELYSNEYFAAYSDRESYVDFIGEMGEVTTRVFDAYMDSSANENYYIRFLEGYFYVLFFELDIDLEEVFNEYLRSTFFSVSFSDYLVQTYGKEKYVELYEQGGVLFYWVYDKSKIELIDEYLQYIYDIFN